VFEFNLYDYLVTWGTSTIKRFVVSWILIRTSLTWDFMSSQCAIMTSLPSTSASQSQAPAHPNLATSASQLASTMMRAQPPQSIATWNFTRFAPQHLLALLDATAGHPDDDPASRLLKETIWRRIVSRMCGDAVILVRQVTIPLIPLVPPLPNCAYISNIILSQCDGHVARFDCHCACTMPLPGSNTLDDPRTNHRNLIQWHSYD
jgi:hypothetical protein